MVISMQLISRMRKSTTIKKYLYIATIVLTLIYVFSVPSFGESSSILRYSIYISMFLLGVCSILFCLLYHTLRIHRFCFLIPIFAIFALIGTIIGSKEYRSWLSLVLLAGSFFVFIFAFKAIENKYLVISIISLGIFFFSLYFIVYYRNEILNFRSYGTEDFRLGFYFDNPNGVSAYAAVGVATALFSFLFIPKKIRYLFVIPLLTSLLVGIVTGSRSFIVAVAIFMVVLLYFKFKKHKFVYLIIIVSIAVLFLVLLNLPFMSTIKQRIVDAIGTLFGFSTKADTSTISRTIWIDYGFYLGARNLMFGLGINGFSIYSGVGTYSHSNFAEMICDFGLIGFILFYLPLILILIRGIIDKHVDKPLVLSFVIYYLLIGFSNVFYYKKFYFLILSFIFYLDFLESGKIETIKLVNNFDSVVFTCDSMSSGGAEKVLASLANAMADTGIQVSIIGVSDTDISSSFYELKNVKYISLGNGVKKRIGSLKRIIKLRKLIKEYSPSVVISFLPHINVYTFFALLGTHIPHIVSERNNPYKDPKGKLLRSLKYIAFLFADGCVFQTSESKLFYPLIVQKKSSIIHNPIVLEFVPNEDCVSRKKVILAVGRLEKQKNYPCLIDAFTIFNKEKNNTYILRIFGEGSLKKELYDYCCSKEIIDYVQFMGADSTWHKTEYMDEMYVLSSDYEGMPNSLAEAIALGIPSISTDSPSGGPRELIKEGVNGFLVPVGDSNSLAKKMIQLTEKDKSLYFDYKKFAASYSIETTIHNWINYITGLKKERYE